MKSFINTQILDVLKELYSIIVGTIPPEIDVENSDLDIVCEVEDFNIFENILKIILKDMIVLRL